MNPLQRRYSYIMQCPRHRLEAEANGPTLPWQPIHNKTVNPNSAQVLFVMPNFKEDPSELDVFYDCFSDEEKNNIRRKKPKSQIKAFGGKTMPQERTQGRQQGKRRPTVNVDQLEDANYYLRTLRTLTFTTEALAKQYDNFCAQQQQTQQTVKRGGQLPRHSNRSYNASPEMTNRRKRNNGRTNKSSMSNINYMPNLSNIGSADVRYSNSRIPVAQSSRILEPVVLNIPLELIFK